MVKIYRALLLTLGMSFLATSVGLAQNAPPPNPQATAVPKPAKPHSGKCKQTPKGCHKKQSKKQAPPPGGAMPQGSPP